MLHERTVPLADNDAVAVRDELDTLVLYAERLTAAQRAALRPYLLEALEQAEGPSAVVAVPAGTAGRVAAAHTVAAAPLGVAGAVVITVATLLIAVVFMAALAVFLVKQVQITDPTDSGQLPPTLAAVDSQPVGQRGTGRGDLGATPTTTAPPLRQEESPWTGGRLPAAELLDDVPNMGRQISPTAAAPSLVDGAELVASESPVPSCSAVEGPVDPPEVEPPDVALRDVVPPVNLPGDDLPATDLPDVDLPDSPGEADETGDEPEDGAGSEDKGGAEEDADPGDAEEGADPGEAEEAESEPGPDGESDED